MNKIKEKQFLIVKLEKFIYLKKPDCILGIIIDNKYIFDYKTKQKINKVLFNNTEIYLNEFEIGIIFGESKYNYFIPYQNYLLLKKYSDEYYISKKIKKKKNLDIPKNNNFIISINMNKKISPSYMIAEVIKIDNREDKKFIDLSIDSIYELYS